MRLKGTKVSVERVWEGSVKAAGMQPELSRKSCCTVQAIHCTEFSPILCLVWAQEASECSVLAGCVYEGTMTHKDLARGVSAPVLEQ